MAGEIGTVAAAPKAGAPRLLNCPRCGGGIMLRAQGFSVTAACRNCGSIIDTTNESLKVISQVTRKLRREPVLPLGQRGKLRGVTWEVIGYMERSEASGLYPWSEYLLFNPVRGYRWLMEFDGHWTYLLTTKDRPDDRLYDGRFGVKYLGKKFHLFHRGTAKVNYVVGEFYWRVKAGEEVKVEDYINPPEVLSKEAAPDEVVWSLGEYVEPEDIGAAFQLNRPMPVRVGVAPNQPSTLKMRGAGIFRYWGYFLGALILTQVLSVSSADSERVHSSAFEWRVEEPQKIEVTPSFELKGGRANVLIDVYAAVENNWLDLELELVNDATGVSYPVEQGVEYYFGRDYDGPWREGSQSGEVLLSAVPGGRYHLNIHAVGPGALTATRQPSVRYVVSVTRDVPMWADFFAALALLSALPVVIAWRNRSFEVSRWSTSDFSPYWSEEE